MQRNSSPHISVITVTPALTVYKTEAVLLSTGEGQHCVWKLHLVSEAPTLPNPSPMGFPTSY